MKRIILCLFALLTIAGCNQARKERVFVGVVSPAAPGSTEPNLAVGADGEVYLTWVEQRGEGHALLFSVWHEDAWGPAREIAAGTDWFVNWADFPSLNALADGTLAAHWLAKVGEGTYAYGVYVSLSHDGGTTWGEPFLLTHDNTATGHGLVAPWTRKGGR